MSRSLKEMPDKKQIMCFLFFNIKNFKAVNELLGVGGGELNYCAWFTRESYIQVFDPIVNFGGLNRIILRV